MRIEGFENIDRAGPSFRWCSAVSLTVVYLMIVLSPLASFAMHSKTLAHAITGECSGDCNICGCSPESRANHTCCCAKKHQLQTHAHEDDDDYDALPCCKKKPAVKQTVISCGSPCGGNKQATLTGSVTSEQLPYFFSERIVPISEATEFPSYSPNLTSRYGEPPDPPHKLSQLS